MPTCNKQASKRPVVMFYKIGKLWAALKRAFCVSVQLLLLLLLLLLAVVDVDAAHLELVYLVTALVPSLTACLASSPGSRRRTAVWISLDVMVERRL